MAQPTRPSRHGHFRVEASLSAGRRKPTLDALKENQRINPKQSKFAPAEGVTPPAEVHACPTVHSAPCTTCYRCLPTGVTGSRSRPTPPGFGQIVHVGLTHGSVSHSTTPASRPSGGFMIP